MSGIGADPPRWRGVPPFGTDTSVDFAPMTASDQQRSRTRQGRQSLALVEAPGSDRQQSNDPSSSSMAVSIAGVSTACSKDALASSAEAVRRTLASD